MAKRPVAFIGFRFEPVADAHLFDDPASRSKMGRLNLEIWRRKADGRAEISETHVLGEAQTADQLDALAEQIAGDLRKARDAGREWFGPRRTFWR